MKANVVRQLKSDSLLPCSLIQYQYLLDWRGCWNWPGRFVAQTLSYIVSGYITLSMPNGYLPNGIRDALVVENSILVIIYRTY